MRDAACGALAAVAAFFGAAAAADDRSGDYVAVRGVLGLSAVDGISRNMGGTLVVRNDEDEVAGSGIAVGYDWAAKGMPLRTELEYHHRYRFDLDTRIIGAGISGFENQLRTDALMVNAYYDLDFGTGFRPYMGAGLGWIRNTSDVERVEILGGPTVKREDTRDSFGWSLMLGVLYEISEGWRFELGYRYIDLGELESGPHSDGIVISADDYISHDIILGLQYRF